MFLIGALLFVVSCVGKEDPYLYDKTGFDVGSMPLNAKDPVAPTRVAPDYYYRQPAYSNQNYVPQNTSQYQPQTQPQPYAPQQQYQPPYYQQQQAPYQQQPASYQQPTQPYYVTPQQQSDPAGGSRFYSNPYAIPPSNQPAARYDADQFYVPPAYRSNIEPQSQQSPQDKSAKY